LEVSCAKVVLFRDEILAGIAQGAVNVAFRRLEPGSVREGDSFVTARGKVTVTLIKPVDAETIRDADAHRAGYSSRRVLLDELNLAGSLQVFRLELAFRP